MKTKFAMLCSFNNDGQTRTTFLNMNEFCNMNSDDVSDAYGGVVVWYDALNNQVPSARAGAILNEMIAYSKMYKESIDRESNNIVSLKYLLQCSWNTLCANEVIAVIRLHSTNFGLTANGINPLTMFNKLKGLMDLISAGMFLEAYMLTGTIENDAFLTPERIAFFQSLLISANAITD